MAAAAAAVLETGPGLPGPRMGVGVSGLLSSISDNGLKQFVSSIAGDVTIVNLEHLRMTTSDPARGVEVQLWGWVDRSQSVTCLWRHMMSATFVLV